MSERVEAERCTCGYEWDRVPDPKCTIHTTPPLEEARGERWTIKRLGEGRLTIWNAPPLRPNEEVELVRRTAFDAEERAGEKLFEVECVLEDTHPEVRGGKTADWLRRALRAIEASAERAKRCPRCDGYSDNPRLVGRGAGPDGIGRLSPGLCPDLFHAPPKPGPPQPPPLEPRPRVPTADGGWRDPDPVHTEPIMREVFVCGCGVVASAEIDFDDTVIHAECSSDRRQVTVRIPEEKQ